MLKKEARKIFKGKRNEVTPSEQLRWDDLLLIRFQTLPLPYLNYVLSFYPIEEYKEVGSFIITDYLHFKNPNLHICYPKINMASRTMQAVICHADSIFETNGYGIPEPVDNETADPKLLDAVLIPLLAFDEKGIRVGYGKGFYDRYLKACRRDCLKIGLSYFEAVPHIEDAHEFDIPLNYCITPQRTYVF
jgi:5-formyltetrahydrofolate cyclo-ligase